MPYLNSPYTEKETRDWFTRAVGDPPATWWIAKCDGSIVAYMAIYGEYLGHLYVRPAMQRRQVGLALLDKAKALSPRRLELRAFQRNENARGFYEAQGFQIVGYTDGDNDEHEPDVKYVWRRGS
jgi:GNAT superfamily N-acetyltransferase